MDEIAEVLRAQFGSGRRVGEYYLPIAQWCVDRAAEARQRAAASGTPWHAVILGINGPQGGGKSTLAAAVAAALGAAGVRALALSIDDLYLPRAGQVELAAAFGGDRLLEHRGYPGTHDVDLGVAVLDSLRRGAPLDLPAYDKSAFGGRGDRLSRHLWQHLQEPVDVVLFDGWMLGFSPLPAGHRLLTPALVATNDLLARYAAWNERLDAMIVLHTKRLQDVVAWRIDAERTRRVRGEGALSDGAARDYIKRFLPAYRAWLPGLLARPPGQSALRVELGSDRLPVQPVRAVDLAKLQRRPGVQTDLEPILSLVERTLRRYAEKSLGHWDQESARLAIRTSLVDDSWDVLSLDGEPLGAIAVCQDAGEMRLRELFLEPKFHGRGWGTALVEEVIRKAHSRGVPVRLRVLRSNPAQQLYLRLGFEVERASRERLWMVARPPQ